MSAPAAAVVRAEIEKSGGWISFARYLELVLHHPQVGFYGSGRVKFGNGGDFITAPGLSPLFGKMLGRQAAQVLRETSGAVLELGAGDGQLAADILRELRAQKAECSYFILETGGALQMRQRETLSALIKEGASVKWLQTLPDSFTGIVIANEVLDAVPFDLFAKRNGAWQVRGVILKDGQLQWEERLAQEDACVRRLDSLDLPNEYETEASPQAEALTATLCGMIKEGAAVFCDYGFGRAEYYHPQRAAGTLMCHCDGKSDDDPLTMPGGKDITAHLDFTAIADAGMDAGAQLAGYVSQAQFLLNCGMDKELEAASQTMGTVEYAKLAAGAQKLLSPHEMGELYKVMAFVKGDMPPLLGFTDGCWKRML